MILCLTRSDLELLKQVQYGLFYCALMGMTGAGAVNIAMLIDALKFFLFCLQFNIPIYSALWKLVLID